MSSGRFRKPVGESIEVAVVRALRVGSVLAAGLIGIGLVLMLVNTAPVLTARFMTAGLVVLILTPVMRVAVSLWVFLQQGDRLFALFCLLVLVALATGFWIGETG